MPRRRGAERTSAANRRRLPRSRRGPPPNRRPRCRLSDPFRPRGAQPRSRRCWPGHCRRHRRRRHCRRPMVWRRAAEAAGELQPNTQAQQQIAQLQQQLQSLQNRPAPTAAPSIDPKTIDALSQHVTQLETTVKNLPKSGGADPQLAGNGDCRRSRARSSRATRPSPRSTSASTTLLRMHRRRAPPPTVRTRR